MELDGLWEGLAEELEVAFRGYRGRLSEIATTVKADHTLLTEADAAIEGLIVDRIRGHDPDAVVIAEEDGKTTRRTEVLDAPDLVWVIDPIDGTAEFVNPAGVEFCSAVCVLRQGEPLAAFLLAPELGRAARPITVTASRPAGRIWVNGMVTSGRPRSSTGRRASVTRSAGTPPRPFEAALERAGYQLKTRTTSQSLDMLRTAVDISSLMEVGGGSFDVFYRPRQKVWDGLVGLCLGAISGLTCVTRTGDPRLPVPGELLSEPEPVFDSTLRASPEAAEWFLEQL